MALKDNTAGLKSLLDRIDDLPPDRYTEGYDKGYDEGYDKGYDKGYEVGSTGEEPEEIEGLIPTDRDVLFIDYDGTELYAYSIEEAKALFALPPLPQHEGLIAEGWNWTLEEVQSIDRPIVVGPTYMPEDGRTKIYIDIPEGYEKFVEIELGQTVDNGVLIDWGDNTTTIVKGASLDSTSYLHEYANPGEYIISFLPISPSVRFWLGSGRISSPSTVFQETTYAYLLRNFVRRFVCGRNLASFYMGAFPKSEFILCEGVDYIGSFNTDSSEKALIIPRSVTSITAISLKTLKYISTHPYITSAISVSNLPLIDSIYIPQGVSDCTLSSLNIKQIHVPRCSSLQSCRFLERVIIDEVPDTLPANLFSGCRNLSYIRLPKTFTGIGSSCFSYCTSLTDFPIPENLVSIGSSAFDSCTMEQISLPDTVTTIGSYAFRSCKNLTRFKFPPAVTTVSQYMFMECTSLKEVIFNDWIDSIENAAFYGCTSLVSVSLPKFLSTLGTQAFYSCSNLREISIPDTVTNLPNSLFSGCSSLETIHFPNIVNSYGSSMFQSCSSLRHIVLPEGATELPNAMFSGNTSIVTVSLPKTLKTLKGNTFYGCTALRQIDLPEGLTTIASKDFYNCSKLEKLDIPDSVTSFAMDSVYGLDQAYEFYFPAVITNIASSPRVSLSYTAKIGFKGAVTSITPSFLSGGWRSVRILDLSNCEQVPTLSGSFSNFESTRSEIYVPAELFNDWVKATNWSSYASCLVPVGYDPEESAIGTWEFNEEITVDLPAATYPLVFYSRSPNSNDYTVSWSRFMVSGSTLYFDGNSAYTSSWMSSNYRYIKIVGGTSQLNPTLVAWLKANATRVSY